MHKLSNNQELLFRLVNRQFQLIGCDVKIQDVHQGVKIKEGKKEKTVDWWKVYFFDSEEDYMKWRNWAASEIDKHYGNLEEDQLQSELNYLDLVFGMNYKIKEGI